ncbi:hypothetical protein AVEN_28951-1 [Araneus ventricosus]|uniref:Uncharacterized protein n=1 Tax=Araneus ventricosus TaxID=182803 RepID=A0A4Y2AKY0_ARAVE|nr:hypothetical protein AVEN_28951-1 [Araneus ventricosus]
MRSYRINNQVLGSLCATVMVLRLVNGPLPIKERATLVGDQQMVINATDNATDQRNCVSELQYIVKDHQQQDHDDQIVRVSTSWPWYRGFETRFHRRSVACRSNWTPNASAEGQTPSHRWGAKA